MRDPVIAAVVAGVLLAACSAASGGGLAAEDGGSTEPHDDAGGGGTDGGSAADSGGVTSESGIDSGVAPRGDSGGVDTGADTGSSSGGGGKLYPLAVGYSWTYDVQAVGAGSVCAAGTQVQSVTGTQMVDSKNAFDLQSFCAAAGTSEVAPVGSGDEVDLDYQGSWLVMIDPTLVDGHTWTYFNSSYTWKRETSVTVPAGTYTDCWTANQNVSYTAYLTYCRGIGLVKSYSSDLTGSGWDAELASKSF